MDKKILRAIRKMEREYGQREVVEGLREYLKMYENIFGRYTL
ncbi:hypothetical protein [Enterococcus sp. AZ102]